MILFLLAGIFLLESALTLSGRPSLVFQTLSSVSLRARRISQLEIWKLRRA
jgi:hypothetical protein